MKMKPEIRPIPKSNISEFESSDNEPSLLEYSMLVTCHEADGLPGIHARLRGQ